MVEIPMFWQRHLVDLKKMFCDKTKGLVRWDRCTFNGDVCFMFGWISRDDGYNDFLAIRAFKHSHDSIGYSYYTSSSRLTQKFDELFSIKQLQGQHKSCISMKDVFGSDISLVGWQR